MAANSFLKSASRAGAWNDDTTLSCPPAVYVSDQTTASGRDFADCSLASRKMSLLDASSSQPDPSHLAGLSPIAKGPTGREDHGDRRLACDASAASQSFALPLYRRGFYQEASPSGGRPRQEDEVGAPLEETRRGLAVSHGGEKRKILEDPGRPGGRPYGKKPKIGQSLLSADAGGGDAAASPAAGDELNAQRPNYSSDIGGDQSRPPGFDVGAVHTALTSNPQLGQLAPLEAEPNAFHVHQLGPQAGGGSADCGAGRGAQAQKLGQGPAVTGAGEDKQEEQAAKKKETAKMPNTGAAASAAGTVAKVKMATVGGSAAVQNDKPSTYYARTDMALTDPSHCLRFTLRDFDIGKFLAGGAHGLAFVARERRTGYIVCLKSINKIQLLRNGMETILKKEVELQSHVSHPHICRLHTWFQTPSCIFLVLEYCHKGELMDYLESTPEGLTEADIANLVFQVTWSVRHCHDKRIAHLDIKPENILLNHKMQAKLADFGLSAHITQRHRNKGLSEHRGTTDYWSPEQCALQERVPEADRSKFNEKTDIWTLGVLAFELFFKEPPFASTQYNVDKRDVARNIRSDDWSKRVKDDPWANMTTDDKVNKMNDLKSDPNARTAWKQRVRAHKRYSSMGKQFKSFLTRCLMKDPHARPTAHKLLQDTWFDAFVSPDLLARGRKDMAEPRHQYDHSGFNATIPFTTPRDQSINTSYSASCSESAKESVACSANEQEAAVNPDLFV
eukprot:GHVT01035571.1.p1 GENE.GHVT01035571.1~~GHVT01035571.1.p1  ORF type:complete len:733 (-),score=119.48 GHVT01035571.1:5294-7492(-)